LPPSPEGWAPQGVYCEGDLRIITTYSGEPAPYDGQLFTTDAAACLASKVQVAVESAQADLLHQWRLWDTAYQYSRDDFEVRISGLEDQNEVLSMSLIMALNEPWYETTEFWCVVGVISGVLVTSGIVLVLE